MANNRLDIVIFGATGYTGKFAVQKAAYFCKQEKMKFGVAGRRKEALEAVIKEFAPDIENIPIILADVKDEESIKKMTEQAKVIANCCGPYRFYGESVVKACIATGTHYVDVTGETEFIENMRLKYNKAAQEAGVYIVSACGFDCIPIDLGVLFTQQKFGGEVNSIETYFTLSANNSALPRPFLNYGTWNSLVHSVAHKSELRKLRTKLYPTKLPKFTPKLKTKHSIHRSDVSQGWSILFPSADRSVCLHTQQFLYEKYKERPVQVQTYFTIKSFFSVVIFAIYSIIFLLMSHTAYGRYLLLKYPSLFSYGFISHESPDPKTLDQLHFSIMFKALGWSEKLAEPTDKHTDLPNKKVITEVSGNFPYDVTVVSLLLSAITILKEVDKIPVNGGVLSSGAAFGKTSLIEKLNEHGIKFKVISTEN